MGVCDVLPPGTPHHYTVFGLRIASCLALPAYPSEAGEPDVWIRAGPVPDSPPEPSASGVLYEADSSQFFYRQDDVARCLVQDGREIVVEPSAGADVERIRLLVMSSPVGALLHQRGLLPLHGSAIEVEEAAVVFAGASGSGKSTLAAAFAKLGYPVIADDISVVSAHVDGPPVVYPGYRQIRLWADAAPEVGYLLEDLVRMRPDLEKYLLRVPDQGHRRALPLKRVYVLEPTLSRDLRLSGVRGAKRLESLALQTYRRSFLNGTGDRSAHFGICSAVSRHAVITRVARPRGTFRLDDLVALLERDFSP